MATTAHCVKCKTRREMSNEREVTMKSGKAAAEGECPVCGTRMFLIERVAPVSIDPRAGLNYSGDLERYRR